MTTSALLFDDFKTSYEKSAAATLSLPEYFDLCKKDPMTYALAAERMVRAIGEPRIVSTKSDPRLLRLFGNRSLKIYDAFAAMMRSQGLGRVDLGYIERRQFKRALSRGGLRENQPFALTGVARRFLNLVFHLGSCTTTAAQALGGQPPRVSRCPRG